MIRSKIRLGLRALVRLALLVAAVLLVSAALGTWRREGFASKGTQTQALTAEGEDAEFERSFPLTSKWVAGSRDAGGAWYIPPSWLTSSSGNQTPRTIHEAAALASRLALQQKRTIAHSNIPLIVHQTWKDTCATAWPSTLTEGVEEWLRYATSEGHTNESMAYFLWLDSACRDTISKSQPTIAPMVDALPLVVERSDVFRIVVLHTYGGVYSDMDTFPLRHPGTWLSDEDLKPWRDEVMNGTYGASSADARANIILGIEADTDPATDDHWRMGYRFPVQLTQWTLASAPSHPILARFIDHFGSKMKELATPFGGNMTKLEESGMLKKEDPLALTGPEAVTVAAMEYLQNITAAAPGRGNETWRWEALSSLGDEHGGRTKVVSDVAILPVTGFSPGRSPPGVVGGWLMSVLGINDGVMGSEDVHHPQARVIHRAMGSWKGVNLRVEAGKACRRVFGRCREWSKVP